MSTMKAIVLRGFGGPEALKLETVNRPIPQVDEVLIRVRAFGINRLETFVRQGSYGAVNFPRVLGIEAVGEVAEDPSGTFPVGARVATAMGGIGQSRDGGYAEYVAVPAKQVQLIASSLDWGILGGLPEIMQTAWGALNLGIGIESGQCLLVRGGTTAVGLGAIGLAKAAGLTVIATTRNTERAKLLEKHGATHVIKDDGEIFEQVREIAPGGVDATIEIVGATTLLDSMKATKVGGTAAIVGMLGPKTNIENFRPLFDLPSRVKLLAYRGGVEEFMKTPLDRIARDIEEGRIVFEPGQMFQIEDTAKAHETMEANTAEGKLVVTV